MATRFETTETLPAYFKSIDKVSKTLSKQEELALAVRIQAGGADGEVALNSLVQANLKFVVTMANKFIGMGLSIDDLIQEANIGLMLAAQKYQPSSGVKFITYAQFHVRKRLNLSICEHGRTVRLPVNQEYALYKRRVAGEDYNLSNIQIDKPIGEDEDGTLGDLVLRTEAVDPFENEERDQTLTRLLGVLKDSDREIVELFYGFHEDALSVKEISARLEKPLSEIGRALKVARHKMRKEAGV